MSDRTANMGLRVELRQKLVLLDSEITELRNSLRGLLHVTASPGELDGIRIRNLAIVLESRLLDWEGLSRKIAILNKELGD